MELKNILCDHLYQTWSVTFQTVDSNPLNTNMQKPPVLKIITTVATTYHLLLQPTTTYHYLLPPTTTYHHLLPPLTTTYHLKVLSLESFKVLSLSLKSDPMRKFMIGKNGGQKIIIVAKHKKLRLKSYPECQFYGMGSYSKYLSKWVPPWKCVSRAVLG